MLDRDDEVLRLSQSLGLSEAEIRLNLGVSEPAASTADDTLNSLAEMFPRVPRPDVREALRQSGGNSERAAELLLSWDALQPEIEMVSEIGSRKLRKMAKKARKESQRAQRTTQAEEKDVADVADILGIPLSDARQIYFEHKSSVTEAVLSKCTTAWAVMPVTQQQAIATMETRNEYSGLSERELRANLGVVDTRLRSVKERARNYDSNPLTRPLSTDAYSELRALVADRRNIERALNREAFFKRAVHSQHRIDLHGLTLDTAQAVSRDVVADFKAGESTSMEIVTGAGRHSPSGRSVIKEWLRGYLKAEKVRAEELEGSFVLHKKRVV